jgi:hypothetical protein
LPSIRATNRAIPAKIFTLFQAPLSLQARSLRRHIQIKLSRVWSTGFPTLAVRVCRRTTRQSILAICTQLVPLKTHNDSTGTTVVRAVHTCPTNRKNSELTWLKRNQHKICQKIYPKAHWKFSLPATPNTDITINSVFKPRT